VPQLDATGNEKLQCCLGIPHYVDSKYDIGCCGNMTIDYDKQTCCNGIILHAGQECCTGG